MSWAARRKVRHVSTKDIIQFFHWLGHRSAVRARFRTVEPLFRQAASERSLIDRWLALVVPWKVNQYPGQWAVAAAVCDVSKSSRTGRLTQWRRVLPAHQCERLARFLEARIAVEQQLILDLRAAGAQRSAEAPRAWAKHGIEERRLIAARKRAERAAKAKAKAALDESADT